MKFFPGATTLKCVLVAALIGPRAAEAQSLLWKLKTNGLVYSSPALGPDGTVYVGSADYSIYAITSAGGLKWKYLTYGQQKHGGWGSAGAAAAASGLPVLLLLLRWFRAAAAEAQGAKIAYP